MDARIKAIWIATLRSGNYKQTQGILRNNNNECCCLGVLCDIVDPKGWVDAGGQWAHRRRSFSDMPTDSVLEQVGLDEGSARYCVRLNDDEGCTFEQIADYVEEWL